MLIYFQVQGELGKLLQLKYLLELLTVLIIKMIFVMSVKIVYIQVKRNVWILLKLMQLPIMV